jgi:hypothetical protein
MLLKGSQVTSGTTPENIATPTPTQKDKKNKAKGKTGISEKNFVNHNQPHDAITGFNVEDIPNAKCLLLVQTGTLNLQGCSLSVESIKRKSKS